MAAITQQFWSGFDGEMTAAVTLDDQTGLASTITVTNNHGTAPMTVTLGTYQGATLWTRTVQPAAGTTPYDVSSLNLHFTQNAKGFWLPPYTIAVQGG